MHDIKAIRADPEGFDAAMGRRGKPAIAPEILGADQRRKTIITALENDQAFLNNLSRQIGIAKRNGGDTAALEAQGREARDAIAAAKATLPEVDGTLDALLSELPNILDPDVPEGRDEADNFRLKTWGDIRNFSFTPRQHFEIGETLGLMDFAGAAKLAGSRFTVLKGPLARLERALGQFMLDLHVTEHGYSETSVRLVPGSCRNSRKICSPPPMAAG
jgi:seryl-tRNA synthetase